MGQERVSCTGQIAAEPDDVWDYLRDFCAAWHPAIARMDREELGCVRAFSVHGEAGLYRERLTWFSDSDREMRYTHLQGINGVDRYDGRLRVDAADGGAARVTMSAEIEATPKRVAEIAAGTQTIFETGLEALSEHRFDQMRAMPVPSAPVSISNRSIRPGLVVSETPAREGPLCVFLHGIGGGRGNWDQQLGQVGHDLQCAAVDLRGYGDSALGPSPSTVDDYCGDILSICEVLGEEKLVLCGLSYGAWIATSFAEKYPELLAGLVLAGGCTGMSEAGLQEREAFRNSREKPLDDGQAPADFAPAVIAAISGPNASAAVKHRLYASMASIPSDTYRDALRCFTNPPGKFDFSRLNMPVLMMTGEHDRLAPPTEIKSVAERIHAAVRTPDIRFEMIKGAGHVCNIEAPEAFNGPLIEFVRRVVK